MNELKDLLPIVPADIGGEAINAVSARDLHCFLEVGKDFSTWIKDRIKKFDFDEGVDFVKVDSPVSGNQRGGDRRSIEYYISLSMAKELAMVERNAKGKQARLYFIECEKIAKTAVQQAAFQIPHTLSEALRLAADLEEKRVALENQIKEDAPKVSYAKLVEGREKGVIIDLVAKKLNVKPHWLRQFMREVIHWLRRDGAPMQWAVDLDYLTYKDWVIPHNSGIQEIKTTTYITGKGEIRLAQLISEYQAKQATGGLFEPQVA